MAIRLDGDQANAVFAPDHIFLTGRAGLHSIALSSARLLDLGGCYAR
jgi:hypothetical protein